MKHHPKAKQYNKCKKEFFKDIDELMLKYQGKNILLVTHTFIAKVINKYFHPELSDDDFFNSVLPLVGVKKFIFN